MKDDKELEQKKLAFVLYGILWFIGLMIAGAFGYQKHTQDGASIFSAVEAVSHFGIFYWLNPVSWGTCLRWTFIYWIGVALFMIYEQKWKHDAAGKEAGSAHWNKKVEEFNQGHSEPFGEKTFSDEPGLTKKMGGENLNNKKTPPVPGNPNMIESELVRLSTADMKTHLNNNVFIVGGAGTGKSRFFIKPNVLQMNCSYIVTDPSGELLKSMHNVLVENGYKIKVFNLVDMSHSNKYNPFRYVRSETDVSILVDCFISNTTGPDQKSGDPFWDKSEKALLSALVFYLVDIADAEFRKFSTILWMVQLAQMDENGRPGQKPSSEFGFSIDMPLDELFDGTKKIGKKTITDKKTGKKQTVLDAVEVTDQKEIGRLRDKIETSLCLTNYKTFKLGGTKTLKSILISSAVRLNPFSIPAIQNLTDDDNVELEKVGDELTCFFAIIPQTNSTFNFLISMCYTQLFNLLCEKADDVYGGRLPVHVRCLIDECANIGQIPRLEKLVATIRSREISACLVLQAQSQLKAIYKDNADTIIGNMDTSIFLGGKEPTTLKELAAVLGKETIDTYNTGESRGRETSHSLNYQKLGKELMSQDELAVMDGGKCILQLRGVRPFLSDKYDITKHPNFKLTADADPKNAFDIEAFLSTRLKPKPNEVYDVYEVDAEGA